MTACCSAKACQDSSENETMQRLSCQSCARLTAWARGAALRVYGLGCSDADRRRCCSKTVATTPPAMPTSRAREGSACRIAFASSSRSDRQSMACAAARSAAEDAYQNAPSTDRRPTPLFLSTSIFAIVLDENSWTHYKCGRDKSHPSGSPKFFSRNGQERAREA